MFCGFGKGIRHSTEKSDGMSIKKERIGRSVGASINAREGLLNEILYVDELVLMSESLEDLQERFQR